jgi:flagellar basal-body rod protein FlgB
VSDSTDAAVVAALRHSMTIAAARQVISAGNLANANTPGFRTQELEFAVTLDTTVARTLAITDSRHLQLPDASMPPAREAEDLPARRDGNTVQIDRELLAMTRASGEFQRAQTALAAKFRLVRYAISESR